MLITIPFKTPSVNHLYFHVKPGVRILTKEARDLKKEIAKIVTDIYREIPNGNFKVTVRIFENWFTLEGDVRKKDLSNREKFLIDSVFDALGIDDKYIFEFHTYKIQSETEEKAEIEIDGI